MLYDVCICTHTNTRFIKEMVERLRALCSKSVLGVKIINCYQRRPYERDRSLFFSMEYETNSICSRHWPLYSSPVFFSSRSYFFFFFFYFNLSFPKKRASKICSSFPDLIAVVYVPFINFLLSKKYCSMEHSRPRSHLG